MRIFSLEFFRFLHSSVESVKINNYNNPIRRCSVLSKSMKRLCTFLLALCMAVSLFSTAMLADENDWDKPCASAAYSDVIKTMWYHQAVDYVLKNNIMTGTSSAPPMFSPNVAVSRAMAVQVLFALAGKPIGFPDPGFTDLTQDWYKEAVNWAVYYKITAGVGDGQFAPARDVTREQMALIFKAAAEYCRIDTSKRGDLNKYSDAGSTSYWAREAMQWAIAVGLMTGTSATTLEPQSTLNRAQLAQMLYRFHSGAIGVPGPATIIGIEATYTGNTAHGTVLDKNNPGISVAAVYNDGHTSAIQDWNILVPVTLVAGETAKVTIFSGAMQCTLEVPCTTNPSELYKPTCTAVTYNNLANNVSAFLGKPVKISGRIFSNPGLGTDVVLYMICEGTEAKKVKLNISYQAGDTPLKINDEVTVYGDFRGMDGSYPSIAVRYYDIDKSAEGPGEDISR